MPPSGTCLALISRSWSATCRILPEFMPMIQVMSVEKSVCVREEEVLLVNGTPITLEGEEGRAIKDCLLRGAIPNQVIGIIAPICSF